MKASAIYLGGIYHDGKQGVRQVTGIEEETGDAGTVRRVTYSLLAAKAETEYSHAEKRVVSLIGTSHRCDFDSFASWAKTEVPKDQKDPLLAELAAKKLRLPPGENTFMASVAQSFDEEYPIKPGAGVSFNADETRAARGVEKKGLVTVAMAPPGAGGEVTLTELGAAWCRARRSPSGQTQGVQG